MGLFSVADPENFGGGGFEAQNLKNSDVFTKIETDFSPDWLRLGRWGGCIPKWSRFIRNKG